MEKLWVCLSSSDVFSQIFLRLQTSFVLKVSPPWTKSPCTCTEVLRSHLQGLLPAQLPRAARSTTAISWPEYTTTPTALVPALTHKGRD